MNKLLIICGPTASGKTSLSIECAKLLKTEIISADSLNVYKDLNIGTAKPSVKERNEIKHHLIDVVESDESFSVGDYKEMAEPIIKNLHLSGKIPIVCGGTGFYVNSLLYNFSYGNTKANLDVREKYLDLAKKNGNEYVYAVLKKLDPKTAEKLHYNDVKRVVRALEIYEGGSLKSDIVDDKTPNYDYKAYAIDYDRETLYKRIDERVDMMIKNGLIDEVKGLIDKKITIDNQCMQGIGYKELYSYFSGEYSLLDAIDLIKLNTRHYAKRQITYFKKLDKLIWMKPDDPKVLAKRIIDNYD